MAIPRHVLNFQILLYASLFLDALTMAFRDRSSDVAISASAMVVATGLTVGLLLLFVYLVDVAVYKRKRWPLSVLGLALGLSVMSVLQTFNATGLTFGFLIDLLSCGLTAGGLYYAVTGDARGWFKQ